MDNFDPEKVKFEDYLHVEGVQALDPLLPAFKTDGVRTKNIKLIVAYLEKKAIEDRLEAAKKNREQLRDEEKVKIESQVSELPAWKQKLVREKLLTKLDEDLPPPETLTVDDLPPAQENQQVQQPTVPKEKESKPIPAWKQRQLEREAKKQKKSPSNRPGYMPVSSTGPEPTKFAPPSESAPKPDFPQEPQVTKSEPAEPEEKQQQQVTASFEPPSVGDHRETEATQLEAEKHDEEATAGLQVANEKALADSPLQRTECNSKEEEEDPVMEKGKPVEPSEDKHDSDTSIEGLTEGGDPQASQEVAKENSEDQEIQKTKDSTEETSASPIAGEPDVMQDEKLNKEVAPAAAAIALVDSTKQELLNCVEESKTATNDSEEKESPQPTESPSDNTCPEQKEPEPQSQLTAIPEPEDKPNLSDSLNESQQTTSLASKPLVESISTNEQALSPAGLKEQTPAAPVKIETVTVPTSDEQTSDVMATDEQTSPAAVTNEQVPTAHVSDEKTPEQDIAEDTNKQAPDTSALNDQTTQVAVTDDQAIIASLSTDETPTAPDSTEQASLLLNAGEAAKDITTAGEEVPPKCAAHNQEVTGSVNDQDENAGSSNNNPETPLPEPEARTTSSPVICEQIEEQAPPPQTHVINDQPPASLATDEQAPASLGSNESTPASAAIKEQAIPTNDHKPAAPINTEQTPTSPASSEPAPATLAITDQPPVPATLATDDQPAIPNEQTPTTPVTTEQTSSC
ncbi:cell surface glycoprotein 1-like [Watersipora subatra]|uniref:cell surface glycoprotein 1-like n=1 Tax=Watersipora subatra TaxID=2589382 RepID=UPI00355BE845